MKTYAAVVRVSHLGKRKQGSDNFHADEDQVAAVEAWGKANGARVEVLPAELNVSGGLPIERRPSLLAAIEGVERGIYAGIVVAYLSRLGRNVAEQLRTWSRVEAAGGEVVSIKEGIDTSTASGRLHRNLLISIDAHEREQHAERFDERRRFATEAGIWQRRQYPRGYLKGQDRRLAPDPQAREEVVAAFADFLRGSGISELGRRLRMTPSGVRALLRNRVYLGELRVGQYVNPAAHEPLIDQRTFDEVQRKLADNTRPARSASGPALLAGLVRCASCGHVMTRTGRGKNGRKHDHNYMCVKRHSGESCPAPAGIVARRVEEHVERLALAELRRLQVEVAETDGVAEAQQAVASAELELDAYLDAVKAADVGAEAFAAGAKKRSTAIETAKDVLYAELARRPTDPALESGADAWNDLNAHERNTLLRSLLAAVIVRPVGKGRRVPVEDRVRVVVYGTELPLPANRGHLASGIVPIFPDADDVGVLSVPPTEDALEAAGGAV
jgi:DNA invertase Pin-like site-specific DNA recombinase